MIHRNHQEETIDNKILIDQINNSNNNLIKQLENEIEQKKIQTNQ
jgi:hypothetical protein